MLNALVRLKGSGAPWAGKPRLRRPDIFISIVPRSVVQLTTDFCPCSLLLTSCVPTFNPSQRRKGWGRGWKRSLNLNKKIIVKTCRQHDVDPSGSGGSVCFWAFWIRYYLYRSRCGSGSRSFHQHEKKVRKTLISIWLLFDFLALIHNNACRVQTNSV